MIAKSERLLFWKQNAKDIKKRIKVTKDDALTETSNFRKEILLRILSDDERRLNIATEFEKSLA